MPLSESQIRTIARLAKEELGDEATFERLQEIVRQAVANIERQGPVSYNLEPSGKFVVICLSRDGMKNAQALSNGLKETGCVIGDRFERNLGGIQTLLASVDRSGCRDDLETLRRRLGEAGNSLGVRIIVQAEETLKKF
jgi:predicted amino acid-binding ACT domain protein